MVYHSNTDISHEFWEFLYLKREVNDLFDANENLNQQMVFLLQH
jgi:hypothetical protein